MGNEGAEPQAGSPNEPGSPASANDPSGRPAPSAPPQPFDREAALAALPEGLRAGLSAQPTPVIQRALQDLQSGFIAKPDYTRTRQQETSELKELREQLQRERTTRETLEQLMERQYSQPQQNQQPQPDRRELASRFLEATDPDDVLATLDGVVGPMVEQRARALIDQDPLMRQLRAAAAADAARPPDMDPVVYQRGYNALQRTFRDRGMDPTAVDPQVVAFLTPFWAELELARARSGGNGQPTPAPAGPAGAPAVTPPSVGGAAARTTTPDVDIKKAYGPESTLKDRVAATLAQLDMTPGDLTRLRQGQRSL